MSSSKLFLYKNFSTFYFEKNFAADNVHNVMLMCKNPIYYVLFVLKNTQVIWSCMQTLQTDMTCKLMQKKS